MRAVNLHVGLQRFTNETWHRNPSMYMSLKHFGPALMQANPRCIRSFPIYIGNILSNATGCIYLGPDTQTDMFEYARSLQYHSHPSWPGIYAQGMLQGGLACSNMCLSIQASVNILWRCVTGVCRCRMNVIWVLLPQNLILPHKISNLHVLYMHIIPH